MRIVARRSSKAAIIVQTGEHEVDHVLPCECVRITKKVASCKPPIKATQTKVLRQPILKVISVLGEPTISRGTKIAMLRMSVWTHNIKTFDVVNVLRDTKLKLVGQI